MSTPYDESTIKEFVAENRDHLEEIEPDLLAMEQGGSEVDPEIVNRVFRAIHSIKGSSGFFRFTSIKELSHVMENVLMRFREGKLSPDSSGIDALLAGVDKLRIMFADVEKSDRVTCREELDRLNAILERHEAAPSSITADEGAEAVDRKSPPALGPMDRTPAGSAPLHEPLERPVLEALAEGFYVYAVQPPDDDEAGLLSGLEARMAEYGQCLGRSGPDPETGRPAYLFATVMETDLLCEALGVGEDRVAPLDADAPDPAGEEAPSPPLELHGAPPPPPEPEAPPDLPLSPTSSGPDKGAYETIRVPVEVIDKLMNLAGELVLGRNQLRRELDGAVHTNPRLGPLIQNVDVVTSEVQERIVQMRMQPMGNLFNKFSRLVRDASRRLRKEVDVVFEGREVELDKTILEGLSDPIIHLLRNGLDHGIEPPATRVAAGKPRKGTLHLRAFHEGGQVNITVRDDGRGIDAGKLVEKAIAQGRLTAEEAAGMSRKEKINLVFTPGFSTADAVSEISGRGVGMDVVKTNIEKLGGHIEISSEEGKGSSVRIRLPLTLAIIPSLIVGAGGHRFAIPQANVKELVCVRAGDVAQDIEEVAGAEVLRIRGSLLPVVRLSDALDLARSFTHPSTGEVVPDRRNRLRDRRSLPPDGSAPPPSRAAEKRGGKADRRQSWHSDLYVVVLKLGGNRFGLCVDELFDTEEIVVKPLSDHVKDVKCFAGATIMGDGEVAMILDAAGIADQQQLRFNAIGAEELRRREEEARRETESGNRHAVLLFNSDLEETFALPLEHVSRLEKLSPEAIHHVGGREFMDYQGEGLPLIRLEQVLPVSPLNEESEELYVIVPKWDGQAAGILASRILDTMETAVPEHNRNDPVQGLLGSSFLDGRMTLFLDAQALLSLFQRRSEPVKEAAVQGLGS
jgi:two-component system chemotaxis sensor kinase CheA